MGIVLATLEVMGRGVRLKIHRIVDPLVCKQARNADHPAFCLADVGQPLPTHVRRMFAPLAVSMLVYDQNALLTRSGGAPFEHELQPTLVGLLRVPPRFRKKPLQALCFLTLRSYNWLGVGQSSERLVARSAGSSNPSR